MKTTRFREGLQGSQGNTLVLIVTAKSVRMKTRTNFFLANLAAADLCVGILCILPNLQMFIYISWLLGPAMCKIYYFAESFSLCVSVLLMAVIAVERYVAVMHPLRARGLFTNYRMHAAQVSIWVLSAVYNIPLMAIFDTFKLPNGTGGVTMLCNIRNDIINLKLYFTMSFILWYTLPLITMSVAYTIISWTLWHSGSIFNQQKNGEASNYYTSTKMTPLFRDNRSSGNISSSSSGGAGSVGECSHNGCGMECEFCRAGNGNIGGKTYDMNELCLCNYCAEYCNRSHPNIEDCCSPCGVATTRFNGSRNDIFVQTQPIQQRQEYNSPVYWSWAGKEEATRNEDAKSLRPASFASRVSGNHGNKNNMCSTCLHYHKTHRKRQNGVGSQQAVTVVNSKQRPTRRSFYSEYASDSSPKNTLTYEASTRRYHPTTTERVLASRRKVVRLLVLVFLTFALCVLPHHIRLLMFYWNVYPMNSFGMSFFPPLAFISLYLNSALNPVLYSLFSESFRRSLRECFRRPWHRAKSCLSRYAARCFRRDHDGRNKNEEIKI